MESLETKKIVGSEANSRSESVFNSESTTVDFMTYFVTKSTIFMTISVFPVLEYLQKTCLNHPISPGRKAEWVSAIGTIVNQRPVASWRDADLNGFSTRMHDLARRFLALERLAAEERRRLPERRQGQRGPSDFIDPAIRNHGKRDRLDRSGGGGAREGKDGTIDQGE